LNYCFFPQGVAIGPGYIGPSARGIALNERYRIFNAHALKGQYNLAQGIALGIRNEEENEEDIGKEGRKGDGIQKIGCNPKFEQIATPPNGGSQ